MTDATGGLTLGSFNHRSKITPHVVRLWAHILTALTKATLVLKCNSLSDVGTQELVRNMFVQHGVSVERIKLVSRIPSTVKHLELYNSIDIGLDTFPYNGTTTTCEALWMGVDKGPCGPRDLTMTDVPEADLSTAPTEKSATDPTRTTDRR